MFTYLAKINGTINREGAFASLGGAIESCKRAVELALLDEPSSSGEIKIHSTCGMLFYSVKYSSRGFKNNFK